MNENDVIKAIECCCENENCRECPLAEMHSAICIKKLMNTTLDLIKRQQAEIEQWKEEANRYQNLWCDAEKDISNARIEAQKDFADILFMVAKGGDGFVDVCDILNTLYVITGKDKKETTEVKDDE
jgi:hypothetical protein